MICVYRTPGRVASAGVEGAVERKGAGAEVGP